MDWSLHGRILKKVGRGYRPSVLKMIWGENPCMVKLCRDGRRENGLCPLCGNKDGPEHFAGCTRMKSQGGYDRIVGNFRAKLRRRNTSPVLAAWLIAVMCGERPVLEREG